MYKSSNTFFTQRTKGILLFDVDIVATEMTINVDDKRTDHVKPLPSC